MTMENTMTLELPGDPAVASSDWFGDVVRTER